MEPNEIEVVGPPPAKADPLKKINNQIVDLLKREDGPTAVEYAVMLALIIVVRIAAVTTLSDQPGEQKKEGDDEIKPEETPASKPV